MVKFQNKTHNAILPNTMTFRIRDSLSSGEFLTSPTSAFVLAFQPDSNLVLYGINDSVFGWASLSADPSIYCIQSTQDYGGAIWATGTDGSGADKVIMQPDGNLVLYSGAMVPSNAVWSSRTYGNDGAYLLVQDDANLVIYGTDGNALWQSGSSVHRIEEGI